MAEAMIISTSARIGGKSVTTTKSSTGTGLLVREATVAVAKVGALTTRTSDTVGELTMAASHGITTAARLDIYWLDAGVVKRRYGVTVGTVATNAVPISGGAGDNLPADETAITAMVPTEATLTATGDNVNGIEMYSSIAGTVILAQSGGTTILAKSIGGANDSDTRGFAWNDATADANPVAGASIGKVYFSHGSSAASATMRAQLLVD